MRGSPLRTVVVFALVALVVLAMPVAARADDDEDDHDVRVERRCTAASTVRLRVRTRDEDRLRVDLAVRTTRRGMRWTVVVVHERRLVLRTTRRTSRSSRALSIRLAIPEWDGRNTVSVRALGPRGEVCRASATIVDD